MKERFRRFLPNNRFARSISVLAGGTVAGQFVIVGASPLLTRLYSPDDFGLLAVFGGLLATISVIASLRYQLAIPLPDSNREAASVTVASLLVVIAMSTMCALFVWLAGGPITRILNTPALEPYLGLLPLGLLLTGIYEIFSYWAIRSKAFPTMARTKLTQSLVGVTVQMGGYAFGPAALLWGQIANRAAGNTALVRSALIRNQHEFRAVNSQDLRQAFTRWRRFPLYSTWGGLFNSAGVNLPPILFAALFSPVAAGTYMLAHRVLQTPLNTLGRSIAQVFVSHGADAHREGRLDHLVLSIHANLAHIAMPPVLVLILTGPDLFALIFGNNWRQAGEFAQWMAPWLYMVFVTSPLSQISSILEKQVHGMMLQAALLLVRVGSLFLGAFLKNLQWTVALYSLSSALCWVAFLIWICHISGNNYRKLIQPAGWALIISAALVMPIAVYETIGTGQAGWAAPIILSAVLITMRYYILFKKAC